MLHVVNDTPQRLLDAMDRVIAEHGPSGVTLRRVGAEAGLSHTAAAHYHRDKPGLFTAYLVRAYGRVADGIEAAASIASPWDSMLEAGRSYAAFALAEPSAFSVMSRLELARVDTPELWAERERGYFALAGIIDRAQRAGWASSRDGLDLIATTWGLVHGIVDLWVGGPLAAPFDGQTLEDTLRRVVADVLVALDPDGAQAIQGRLDQG